MLRHAALIAATTLVTHFRRVRHCERHRLPARRASGEDLMVGIDQVDPNLVRAGWHPGDVDCIGVARVPPPGHIVDVYVQMPHPWRYVEGACPEHRHDVHVLDPVLYPDDALGLAFSFGSPQQSDIRNLIFVAHHAGLAIVPRSRHWETMAYSAAVAAFSINAATSGACERKIAWLPGSSMTCDCARLVMNRSRSGLIIRSCMGITA